jgi:hypothetical protein
MVALMLGLWLGLVGAASSERLHGWLHADAGKASHDCLVTHLAGGQFLLAGAAVLVVAACGGFWFLLPQPERLSFPAGDVRLPSSRGPPADSLLASS